jgi:PAS domain S-box-containing protein
MEKADNFKIDTFIDDLSLNLKTDFRDQVFYKYDFNKHAYQFMSPSIFSLTGYTMSEINKIGFENIIRNKLVERNNNYSLNGSRERSHIEEYFVTYLIETHNGDYKWIEDNSFTIVDTNGNKLSKFGILKDVSAYMRDEKIRQVISEILEAANSEKNIEELFRFIHNCIKKLMKADNFYIAYYKRDTDLLTFPYFVDEADTDSSSKKLGKGLTEYVLRTGKSELVDIPKDEELRRSGEIELIGPQSEIWLGVPIKIKDKTIGVMVVQDYNDAATYGVEEQKILDVISYPISRAIERKLVEEEREEMIVKLKEMNKSKDQLFSLISHDLRSPFNSLLGFADILSNEFDSLTQRDIKEYLNVINESSKTLYGITNNLLHYSRLQLGKFEYKPQTINLKETINNILVLMKDRIKKKNVLIKKEISKDYNVFADEDLLNITLENIISNAIKFSYPEGIIKIFAEQTEPKDSDEAQVQISITDEGVGIDEETQKKIKTKEMYSTLGTEKEFGIGLGLLLSKEFIKINKGTIEIISSQNNGTTAIITLPGIIN